MQRGVEESLMLISTPSEGLITFNTASCSETEEKQIPR